MVSLLKGLFGQRELTDAELYSAYKKSPKKIYDFEKYIMNIKEGKETIALKEICEIKLSNVKEIDELIVILEKNNIGKGISLSTNRDKRKLNGIYNQLKKISYIHKNFIEKDDIENFIHFTYSNKYDLFSKLKKIYDKNKNPALLTFIYDEYFNQQNYLSILEYFLFKDFENNIKFLLPNETNYIQLQLKNAIPIYINLSDVYYNIKNEENNIDKINDLLLNIIIYFFSKHNENQISKNLQKYIPIKNTEIIEIILSLYGLAKKIDPNLTLQDFTQNQNLVKIFKKLATADYDTFSKVFNNIMANVKEYSNIYRGLKYLPLELIRDMIESKVKYDFITKGIDIIINSNEYNNNTVFNFILKYLFECYCFNKMLLKQLSKIVNYLSKYNTNYNQITNQLDSLIDVIEIFEHQNIKFVINELVMDDINDISKNNIYILAVVDYLNILAEKSIQYNNYDFIDNSIIELNQLISYKKGLTYGKILIYYFEKYQNKRPLILNVITSNKNIILHQDEIKSLINLYLLNPYLIKVDSYTFIEEFLDGKNYPLDAESEVKIERLLEYLKIKKYIQKYNIDDSSFKDYTLDNYSENILGIMKLLLIKTTDLEKTSNINNFLKSPQSKDIQSSLRLEESKYIYYLFKILMEFEKVEFANEIINLFLKNEDRKYFNKCIDYVYNKHYKKDNERFKAFCHKANINDYLLENNNKYLDILIDNNDFIKEERIAFPLEKQPNDLLVLYSLIKNNKINKDKNKSCNSLIISYDKYKESSPEDQNLENLIDSYYKNKIDDDTDNNRVNYNYSLHPKLIELLKSKKCFYLFQDLKITFKAKIKIYNFCIKNNICTLTDIINNYETIRLKQKAKTDKEIIEKFKLLFNLYKEKDENNDIYKELLNFTKSNYSKEQNEKNTLLLIDFNLSNKLFISYDNLLFLHIFFDYKMDNSSETKLKLLRLLSSSNSKINILPFCSDFDDIFLKNKNYETIMEKYYKNNLPISLKENNSYFEEIKTKNMSTNPNVYYQSLEIYNILNIANYSNIKNILEYLNEKKNNKINFNFLFAYKMTMKFLTTNCIIPNRINYGLNNLFGILISTNLSQDEINQLLKEIFFFQSKSYINNSNHNILLFNEKCEILIRNFMNGKKAIVDGLVKMYYGEKIDNILMFSAYKIFLVKNAIIKEMKKDEISNIYNDIQSLHNYNEILETIEDNKVLKEKINDIYSQ